MHRMVMGSIVSRSFPNMPEKDGSGMMELLDFASQTLEGLIERESAQHDSSLGGWCRMDIGLLRRQDDWYYFVNEVERSIGLGLYGEEVIEAVTNPLADLIYGMLQSSVV